MSKTITITGSLGNGGGLVGSSEGVVSLVYVKEIDGVFTFELAIQLYEHKGGNRE